MWARAISNACIAEPGPRGASAFTRSLTAPPTRGPPGELSGFCRCLFGSYAWRQQSEGELSPWHEARPASISLTLRVQKTLSSRFNVMLTLKARAPTAEDLRNTAC